MKNSALNTLLWQAIELYAADALYPLLSDPSKLVRYAAARRLQRIGGRRAFEAAKLFLKKGTINQREVSAFLLGQLDQPKLRFRSETVPLLISVLKSDANEGVRSSAAVALGHLGDEKAIIPLKMALQNSSDEMRSSVAASLSMFENSEEAKAMLVELRKDKSPKVRYWAEE